MRVLLDNCLDVRVKRLFVGHEVAHARDLGWRDLENGKLLAAAADNGFEVMVTVDKNIRHQQNLATLPIPVLELHVVRNRFRDIAPLASLLEPALKHAKTHRFVSLDPDGAFELLAERERPKDREPPHEQSRGD